MSAHTLRQPAPEPVDILEETVRIPGPAGALAGVLAFPLVGTPGRAALMVGPHPLMGGRLENNVVRAVSRGLAEHGLLTLRFAFAGKGPTAEIMEAFWRTGHAPDDALHCDEACAAARWLGRMDLGSVVLVGYSFGASLLAELFDELPVSHVVMISPTLSHHDFSAVARSRLPKLLITASNDFATPAIVVQNWFADCAGPKSLVILESAEHFFRAQESRVVGELVRWLRS